MQVSRNGRIFTRDLTVLGLDTTRETTNAAFLLADIQITSLHEVSSQS